MDVNILIFEAQTEIDMEKRFYIRNKINCVGFEGNAVFSQLSSAMLLNSFTAILVLSGNASISVNYRSYRVTPGTVILLSASHVFRFTDIGPDLKCMCLFVSREFMEEMDSTDMIHRRIKYGVRLFSHPVLTVAPVNSGILEERLHAVRAAIENTSHIYYKEVILNNLFAFYLDLSDIIDRAGDLTEDGAHLNRYENLIKLFMEQLVSHYRREHKTEFYASQLNISPHYLTLILKRITGQSASDFIFEMLYSEARMLLKHSRLSIQEIASLLHFSDQSSFGKFFKRKSGLSPADYRKKQ